MARGRVSTAKFIGVEHFVRQIVQLGRVEGTAKSRAILGSALDAARDVRDG